MTRNGDVLPKSVTREEWLAARKELLDKEKEFSRARDALNADRRKLPMVMIGKNYIFEGAGGKATLLDLFEGRSQLIIRHFMFDPDWDEGCPSCSFSTDNTPNLSHLHARDTTLVLVSRARVTKLEAYKRRMGWNIPWYSSYNSDFNYDFGVTIDERCGSEMYNFKTKKEHEEAGTGYYFNGEQPFELPGVSCFIRDDDRIYHTYSAYGRGDELLDTTYMYLDLTVLGRQENWEQPPGRSDGPPMWWIRRHDEYDSNKK